MSGEGVRIVYKRSIHQRLSLSKQEWADALLSAKENHWSRPGEIFLQAKVQRPLVFQHNYNFQLQYIELKI